MIELVVDSCEGSSKQGRLVRENFIRESTLRNYLLWSE